MKAAATKQQTQSEPVMPMIVSEGFNAHWLENKPADEYHADKSALSSSGLRKALKSPATFRAYWTATNEAEASSAMQFGNLAHLCVLEPWKFAQTYCVQPDFGDMRSSKNREKRDEWRAAQDPGVNIVTEQEYETLHGMVQSILNHDDARQALTNGKAELSGWYRDSETGLLCRIRPDFLHFNSKALIDLKTTESCEEHDFSRSILNYGYATQLAMYAAGCEAINGVRIEFPTIIAIEKKPPYEIAVYVLDQGAMDYGTAMYRRGLRRIAEAVKSGKWPGYQQGVKSISVPAWAFTAGQDELENEIGA